MEIILFIVFLTLGIIFLILGLVLTSHTEFALIGLLFIFLLSFVISSNSIVYAVGFNSTTNYTYSAITPTQITSTMEVNRNHYDSLPVESNITHYFSFYLAVVSVIIFAAILFNLGKARLNSK